MVSGIPVKVGLGTKMSDPYVYVVFRATTFDMPELQSHIRVIIEAV